MKQHIAYLLASPCTHSSPLGTLQGQTSPSFLSPNTALWFGQILVEDSYWEGRIKNAPSCSYSISCAHLEKPPKFPVDFFAGEEKGIVSDLWKCYGSARSFSQGFHMSYGIACVAFHPDKTTNCDYA